MKTRSKISSAILVSSFWFLVSSFGVWFCFAPTQQTIAPIDLKTRTRDFALRIVHLYGALPKSTVAQVIGRQVLRSGTSVGANYREGIRARSSTEYATKLNISLMELEETAYWLELLEESVLQNDQITHLKSEAGEL
jgi:four helix bundle protein